MYVIGVRFLHTFREPLCQVYLTVVLTNSTTRILGQNILSSSSFNKATLSFVPESVLDLLSPTFNTGITVQFTVIVYITLHF